MLRCLRRSTRSLASAVLRSQLSVFLAEVPVLLFRRLVPPLVVFQVEVPTLRASSARRRCAAHARIGASAELLAPWTTDSVPMGYT